MAACGACGTTILFGGVRDGKERFCNNDCHAKGYLVSVSRQVPDDLVRQHADAIHHGLCPRCHGSGPVDVHNSYRVWSAFLLTSWKTVPLIACGRCGVKSQIGSALFSLFLGWWGIPWGLVLTPVQIGRNIAGMFRSMPAQPSDDLRRIVSLQIAAEALRAQGTGTTA